MNKNLDSPTKLTEFAPLSPEEKSAGVGYLFSRFFKRGSLSREPSPSLSLATSGSSQDSTPTQSVTSASADKPFIVKKDEWRSLEDTSDNSSARDSTASLHPSTLPFPIYADIGDGRSLPNVLKRISNLLAMKSNGLQAYKDTDFKQYWMPDSVSKECYDCGDRFTTFRRRHHCRVCGQIFCSRCCNQEIPGKIMGCTGDLRVCTYCCKVVLSYLQSADICADLSADMRALQEDLQSKFGDSSTNSLLPPPGLGTNSGTQQTNPLQSPIEATRERSTRTISNRRKHSYQEDRFAMGRSGNLASPSSYLTSEELQLCAEERWQALQGSSSLRALWEYMKRPETGVPLQSHRYRLRSFPACFVGTQLVDWLLANNRAATMVQAVALGQALIEAGYMECVSHMEPVFQDGYALYRLRNQPASGKELPSSPSSPPATSLDSIWTKHEEIDALNTDSESESCEKIVKESDTVSIPSSGSTFYLDLDVQGNHVQLRRTRHKTEDTIDKQSQGSRPSQELNNAGISREFLTDTLLVEGSDTRELVPSMGWHRVENLRTDNGENEAYIRLTEAFDQHQRCLLQQLLSAEGLSQSWGETITSLVHQIVELVRPDVKNDSDDMDIRQYVQFKKVSGGGRSECNVVSGVVCTKNVAHRSMQTRLTNPRILLLGCSIIYERIEGRFLSLEPLIMQEQDYLKNAVARIVSLQPDLVLVEKTVSRLAQDLLLDQGITLALNMKQSVLERLSRLTQADILTCVDAHVGKPRIGMCHNFFLRTFQLDDYPPSSKTLMFFDGCATHLGCTVILRGGSSDELKRVKKVLGHLILVHYSWRLEKSFLMDEFAMPPSVPVDSFFAEDDITKENTSCVCEISDCPKSDEKRKLRSRAPSREKSSAVDDIKIETVVDQSDPLHQYLAGAGSHGIGGEETTQLSVATLPLANRFRKALDGTILSSSPYLQYIAPFLETEAGRHCALRRFFPEQVFWSPQFDANSNHIEISSAPPSKTEEYFSNKIDDPRFVYPCHNFVNARLTKCLESWEVQALLASFRASGGCLRHPEEVVTKQTVTTQQPPASTPVSELNPKWPQQTVADSLSSLNHQRITVLFCSFSHESNNAPAFCVNPWVVHMELYGRNDIPLGQFLQHYCFRKTYTCPSPSCSTPMLRHIRRFVHDACCVQVTLKELDSQIPVEGNAILMWSWCSVCKLVSPVVPMSVDTWSLSFAKYLELRFHGHMYTRRGKDQTCPHSLHHTHYQYFGFRDVVASFKLTSVALWEISLPADRLLNANSGQQPQVQTGAIEEVKHLSVKGYEVFATVADKLCQLSNDADSSKQEGISSLKTQLSRDKVNFKSKIEEIQLKLTSPTLEAGWLDSCSTQPVTSPNEETNTLGSEVSQRLWDVEDCLVQLKRMIAEAVTIWNSRLSELSKSNKKSGDTLKVLQSYTTVLDSSSADETSDDVGEHNVAVEPNLPITESAESGELQGPSAPETGFTSSSETTDTWAPSDSKRNSNSLDVPDETCDTAEMSRGHERSQSDGAATPQENSLVRSERRSIPQVPPSTAVKHIFSQLLPLNVSVNLIVSPLSGQEHPLLPPSLGPNLVVYENEPSSIIAYTLCSAEYHRKLAETRQPVLSADGPPPSPIELKRKPQQDALNSELLTSNDSQSSTRRTVLSFLRGGSPNLSASRSSVVSTPRYQSGSEYDGVQYTAGSSGGFTDEEPPLADPTNIASSTTDKQKSVKNSQVASENSIDVHFSDSTTSFHCRVYLPEQFIALRALVCPEGEESYARSLSRCVQWAARGGKSGSAFSKTRDDRFVLKEMKKNELDLFLEIAPNYLQYIQRALEGGQPTLLGKIVGVYRVGYRGVTGTAGVGTSTMKTHFLVMENLFYGRMITQRFDLKGSMRNRLVETNLSNQGGEIVLLDENLLKMTCDSPLYIHPHSKLVLTLAIERDTQFLASQAVMDYSLLVGLDEEKRELVLGIIDYIRTFTWDKKLETMVKSSGILGGQGKLPTIVSPELYQSRFIAAMHRYFLPVPDRWTGLGKGVDC